MLKSKLDGYLFVSSSTNILLLLILHCVINVLMTVIVRLALVHTLYNVIDCYKFE